MLEDSLKKSERSESVQNLKQLKGTEVKELREKILKKQGYRCAICGKEITLENSVLDHQHKQRKSDINGENGNGQIRGVLCQEDNLCEGKIWNSTGRFQGARTPQDRINWLRKLIEYYSKDPYPFIHPTEKVPEKSVSKRQYNKLKKVCETEDKVPEYPKSTHLTKKLKELFDKYKINPFTS